MFRNFRDGRFAIGLVVGVVLATITLTSINPPKGSTHSTSYGDNNSAVDQRSDDQKADKEQNALGYWARRMVSLEDTSAQWLMTIFSIIASGLLLWTLAVTRKMAADTRRIGEAQVRAYLTFEKVTALPEIDGESDVVFWVNVTIRNCGQSPARHVRLVGRTIHGEAPREFVSDIAATGTASRVLKFNLPAGDLLWDTSELVGIGFDIEVSYRDVFTTDEEGRISERSVFTGYIDVGDGSPQTLMQVSGAKIEKKSA